MSNYVVIARFDYDTEKKLNKLRKSFKRQAIMFLNGLYILQLPLMKI